MHTPAFGDSNIQHASLVGAGPLGELLGQTLPSHLYHYTGPAGVIGILQSRALWAGRPADMNDSTEQLLVRGLALEILGDLKFPVRSFGEGMTEYALELLGGAGWPSIDSSRAYTVSLTSEPDSLEQWRAYCPRSGGVALGFSATHLRMVASDQKFILAPCVYEMEDQRAIVQQIVDHHLAIWSQRQPLRETREGISSHLVRDLISTLERYGPLLKHSSFAGEREWRLISPLVADEPNAKYTHTPGATGIRQFQVFSLLTTSHPVMGDDLSPTEGIVDTSNQAFRPIIGPNVNPSGMEEAILALTPEEFGWIFRVERTASPYR